MKTLKSLALAGILASSLCAQTQLVRGDVDSISQTNRWRLDCTNIELVSSTVNLQQLHDISRRQDIEFEMQVRDVSSGGRVILDVVSAKQIPELMDMGNLRFGRSDSWSVHGTPGSVGIVMLNHVSRTGYLPLGGAGTWLLGLDFMMLNAGVISSTGQFRFQFQPPRIPSLVGQTFVSQAIVVSPNNALLLTNPDCKEVRND